MYVHWEEELDKHNEFASHIPPPSSISLQPIPLHLSIARKYRKRGRRLHSAGTQVISGHGFFYKYSVHFRPTADDNIMCPYHALSPHRFTYDYILTQCPLHSTSHQHHFGRHHTLNYILALRMAATPSLTS
jgi:hypothetical protein